VLTINLTAKHCDYLMRRCTQNSGSSLSLVFGLENLVDFLSSCVVLWRFFAPTSLTDALEQKLKQREDRASVAISFLMILLGICILSASISDMKRGQEELVHANSTLVLTFLSVLLLGTLTVIKFRYAKKLDSSSMYKDGQCSFIGTFLAMALFVNTALIIGNPKVWWIDPVAAFSAGIVTIVLGICAIVYSYTQQGLPIFSKSWWINGTESSLEIKNQSNRGVPAGDQTDFSDEDIDSSEII
jgi:hypothetical protein